MFTNKTAFIGDKNSGTFPVAFGFFKTSDVGMEILILHYSVERENSDPLQFREARRRRIEKEFLTRVCSVSVPDYKLHRGNVKNCLLLWSFRKD